MYFKKYDHPSNFVFDRDFDFQAENLGDDVFRVTVADDRWATTDSQAELDAADFAGRESAAELRVRDERLMLTVGDQTLLRSLAGRKFGVCGNKWMFCFTHSPDMRFYGLGEKNNGFEKTGVRSKFWNTDVFADFHWSQIREAATDPMYVSIPYLIVKRGNVYCGILVDNPYDVFVSIKAQENVEQMKAVAREDYFMLGSTDGRPTLYVLYGPSLAGLTRKLQRLCGPHHRPPLWALGHQQCRWGYDSARDLKAVHDKYLEHNIPTDGLWLDIDYMERYKVFTFSPDQFDNPKEEFAALQNEGRHCLAILDPGVKVEPGYPVYESGCRDDVFCRNREGGQYVGFVWPGATAFPDFSLPEARAWWAEWTAKFLEKSGLDGFWLDMNDPSTGSSALDEMRFDHGRKPHGSYHNQYALGMQKATCEGFVRHDPERRPFLVSRSGFTSSSRYCAIWTGDNCSNYFHLRQSIPMCLNLSLSGIPFCGPDVTGFAGNPTPGLARDWYKAGFLFPFFRNHSDRGSARKEPWTHGRESMAVIRRFIALRYRLIPYLYQLFVIHESQGDPILRPLFYEFADGPDLPLDRIDDQFMVGPSIMQAPFVDEKSRVRQVILPGPDRWFDPWTGAWLDGGQTVSVRRQTATTPLFVREGAVLPMLGQVPRTGLAPAMLRQVQLHAFASPDYRAIAQFDYLADDGTTFAYRRGVDSAARLEVEFAGERTRMRVQSLREQAGPLSFELLINQPWPEDA